MCPVWLSRTAANLGSDRLQLLVEHKAPLNKPQPLRANGWWPAVDGLQGRCVVVSTRSGEVDLSHFQVGEQLAALMGTGRSAFAALTVELVLH